MRHVFLASSIAMAAVASPSQASDTERGMERVMTLRLDGQVTLDADGRATTHTLDTSVPAELQAAVAKGLASWKFDPPTASEIPGQATRSVRITMVAKPQGKDFQIKVENVYVRDRPRDPRFEGWPPEFTNFKKPKGVALGANAIVTFAARVRADGRLGESDVTQCSVHTSGGNLRTAMQVCRKLEESVRGAAREWRFSPRTRTGAEAGEWIMAMPFSYQATKAPIAETLGEWRWEYRTAYREPDWRKGKAKLQKVGASDVVGDGIVNLEATSQAVE